MGKLNAIQRYLLIIRKIKSTPYITLENLQQEIAGELLKHGNDKHNFSTRTLKRDIRDIRTELNIPVTYSRSENGYYFPATEIWSPDNIERLLEPFDILNSLNCETGLNHIVFPEHKTFIGTENLLPAIQAIKDNRPVRFRYQKYSEDTPSVRVVHPYAVKECRFRWYLLGIEEGNTELKTFGLDRITQLEFLPGKFKRDTTIDIKNRFNDLFGILGSDTLPVEDLILSFDSRDGKYLKSVPLHHSQEIIRDCPSENEFIIRLHVKITRDLIMELLSRSRSLKVIRPLHLKDSICKIYQKALKRNNSATFSEMQF